MTNIATYPPKTWKVEEKKWKGKAHKEEEEKGKEEEKKKLLHFY
jgi:hypothetical protein